MNRGGRHEEIWIACDLFGGYPERSKETKKNEVLCRSNLEVGREEKVTCVALRQIKMNNK